MKKKIAIEGMSCEHCVKHVTEALSNLAGISKVEVNLGAKYAVIEGSEDIDDQVLLLAIDDAGYEAKKIENI